MNIATLFWQTCEAEPEDKVALATQSMTRRYGELRRRVAHLIHRMRELGIGPGDRVGILGRNSPEYCEAFWATVSLGAVVVALNFRLAPRELERVCAFADLRAYFSSRELLPVVAASDANAARKPVIVWSGGSQEAAGEAPGLEPIDYETLAGDRGERAPVVETVDSASTYSIIFTGGTSGTPKAVERSHRNFLASLHFAPGNDFVGRARTVLSCTPMFHIAGQSATSVLAQGGTLVFIEGTFSGRQFLRLVERFRVSAAFVVPVMVAGIANTPADEKYEVSSLRELRCGGAPLPKETAQRLVERFPNLRFSNGAGSTEAGVMASAWWDDLQGRGFGCIGRPPVGQELRIVDEHLRECDVGQMGEIVVRGAQLASGYWKDPERTATSFHDGWQFTADLGHIDADGYVYLVDRKSDMIISGGENVYAREVEEVLHRMPRVREAAVVGMPDERWGEVPVAIVALADDNGDTTDIEAAIVEWLAPYKRPKAWRVVKELPRTSVGKIDKNALRAMLRS